LVNVNANGFTITGISQPHVNHMRDMSRNWTPQIYCKIEQNGDENVPVLSNIIGTAKIKTNGSSLEVWHP
jgi:hypothetical protein